MKYYLLTLTLTLLMMSGCDKDKPKLPGNREAIFKEIPIIVAPSKPPLLPPQSLKSLKLEFETFVEPTSVRGFLGQPSCDKESFYMLDGKCTLWCFDKKKGKTLWKKEIFSQENKDDALGGSVQVHKNIVYVTCAGGEVHAFSRGKILWSQKLNQMIRGVPSIQDKYMVVIASDLICIDISSGDVVWKIPLPLDYPPISVSSQPVIGGETIFSVSGNIQAHHLENGNLLWTQTKNSKKSLLISKVSPVLDDGFLFVVDYNGDLMKLHRHNGEIAWKCPVLAVSTPVIEKDVLFVTTKNHDLCCIAKQDGKMIWKIKMESQGVHLQPVVYQSTLLILDENGTLRRYHKKTGQLLKTETIEGAFSQPPFIDQNHIVFVSDEGKLSAYSA